MGLENFKNLGRAAAFVAALGGAASCESTQEKFCRDQYPGYTVKIEDEACLPPGVNSVDELKRECKGNVVKVGVISPQRDVSGVMWDCYNPHEHTM
jgi:hypothetical protein